MEGSSSVRFLWISNEFLRAPDPYLIRSAGAVNECGDLCKYAVVISCGVCVQNRRAGAILEMVVKEAEICAGSK